MRIIGKSSTHELVGDIASALESEPKSISQIADEVESDRRSVKEYLEALTNAPSVKEYESEDSRERLFGRSKICGTCGRELHE